VGDLVELFDGPVARLYKRSLEDQGFEVLMMTVFDLAARHGYTVAREIVKDPWEQRTTCLTCSGSHR